MRRQLIFIVLLCLLHGQIFSQSKKSDKEAYYSYSLQVSVGFLHYETDKGSYRRFSMPWISSTLPNAYFQQGFTFEDYADTVRNAFSETELKELYEIKKKYRIPIHIKAVVTEKGSKYEFSYPENFLGDDSLMPHLKKLRSICEGIPRLDLHEFTFHTTDSLVCSYEVFPKKRFRTDDYLSALAAEDLSEIDSEIFKENPFKAAYLHWIHEYRYIEEKTDENRVTLSVRGRPNSDIFLHFPKHHLIVKGKVENGICKFRKVPLGEKVQLIVVDYENFEAAFQTEVIANKEVTVRKFGKYTLQEFSNALFE